MSKRRRSQGSQAPVTRCATNGILTITEAEDIPEVSVELPLTPKRSLSNAKIIGVRGLKI